MDRKDPKPYNVRNEKTYGILIRNFNNSPL